MATELLTLTPVTPAEALPSPAILSNAQYLRLSGSELRSIAERVEREHAALVANGGKIIFPQLIANREPLKAFPTDANGLPDADWANGTRSLSGEFDFGPAFDEAYYESMKCGLWGGIIVVFGTFVTRRPFYLPHVTGKLLGYGFNASHIVYDGAVNTPFLKAGPRHVPDTALPVTNVAVVGGNTVLTIGTTGAKHRPLVGGGTGATVTALTDTPWTNLGFDPWGQWLAFVTAVGVSDNNMLTSYVQRNLVAINVAARTITLSGTLTFTPTWLRVPPLSDGAVNYEALSGYTQHRFEQVSDIQFSGRARGRMEIEYFRGIKGRADPLTMLSRLRFNKPYSWKLNFDSDSFFEKLFVSQSATPLSLSAVDSGIEDFQFSATPTTGLIMDRGFGQTKWAGRVKGYYLGQDCRAAADAISVHAQFVSNVEFVGSLMLEDTNGTGFMLEHQTTALKVRFFEGNNMGCVGLGAPFTIDNRLNFPCDVVVVAKNASVAECEFEGIIRANEGNRDGFHVRSAWRVEKPTKWDTSMSVPNTPFLIRDCAVDFNYLSEGFKQSAAHLLPDVRRPIWNATTAYVRGDIVQLTNTAQEIRYQATTDHPAGEQNPAVRLAANAATAGWLRVGGMRNAWERAFIDESNDGTAFFVEFWNMVVRTQGERDPSYHQRVITGRPAFTVDPEHDVVRVQMGSAAESRFDVFPGRQGKEQLWRALDADVAKPFILQPGYRNNGAVAGRPATLPALAGAVATLTRPGSEFKTVWDNGRLVFVPHVDNTEVLPAATTAITLNLSDFGKTLVRTGAGSLTITVDVAALFDPNWYVFVRHAGTGSVTFQTVSGTTLRHDADLVGTIKPGALIGLQRVGSTVFLSGAMSA